MPVSHKWVCIPALLGCIGTAHAADLFYVTLTVGSQSNSAGFTTSQQVFDGLRESSLESLVPSYTGAEVARMRIDFRGLILNSAYPVYDDPRLDLDVPDVGIQESFLGATREESLQLLRDYFRNGDALGRIMRSLAATSPVDPIAGNPASLQSTMVSGSFDRHFRGLASGLSARSLGVQPTPVASRPLWLASASGEMPALGSHGDDLVARANATAGIDVASYSSAGLSSTVIAVPFMHAFDSGPERALSIDGELQTVHTEGAKTWGGNVGLAYRARMNSRWYLVPSATVGVTSSPDLGSSGTIVSAALTSAFRLAEQADYVLWMGNAVNLLRTVNTTIGDYSFDPELSNAAFSNGLVLSLTPSSMTQNHWWEFSFVDTRYTGSDLYDERYDELGVAVVWARRSGGGPATMRAELTYVNTSNSNGWGLKFQASF